MSNLTSEVNIVYKIGHIRLNVSASALLKTPMANCEENGEAHKPIEIPGYKYQQSGKVQCSNGANMVFNVRLSSVVACSKKCTNAPGCFVFAFSESDQCVGYKTCTKKNESNEITNIYGKGNIQNFFVP